jgi:pyrroloquinoline quinone (PQQ) biosynthesis protein C
MPKIRISDRAADEAAHILSTTPDTARELLAQWIARVVTSQAGVVGKNGQRSYRGPKPWRLQLVVDSDDTDPGEALAMVLATADTRRWSASR